MKMLTPGDISEVMAGLINRPDLLGVLQTPEEHTEFLKDLMGFLTERFGGEVKWVVNPILGADAPDYMTSFETLPHVAMLPSEGMASKHDNIWRFHDQTGWDLVKTDVPEGEPVARKELNQVRGLLQESLKVAAVLSEPSE